MLPCTSHWCDAQVCFDMGGVFGLCMWDKGQDTYQKPQHPWLSGTPSGIVQGPGLQHQLSKPSQWWRVGSAMW